VRRFIGCVGSRKVAGVQKVEKLKDINKVISFDRRGTDSIITFQSSQRCCSDKFGDLQKNLMILINHSLIKIRMVY
jgi:hypothetical protein